jgi:hypothetical protein
VCGDAWSELIHIDLAPLSRASSGAPGGTAPLGLPAAVLWSGGLFDTELAW